jgi:hypothetical protein
VKKKKQIKCVPKRLLKSDKDLDQLFDENERGYLLRLEQMINTLEREVEGVGADNPHQAVLRNRQQALVFALRELGALRL